MKTRSVPSADDLGEQHLDVGLALGQPLLDIGLQVRLINSLLTQKKAGERPLSVLLAGDLTPARKLSRRA